MYVFVDLETTGLVPAEGRPLELGIGIYDDKVDLQIFKSWLITPTSHTISQMDNFVKEMHTKSGLLEALELVDQTSWAGSQSAMGLTEVASDAVKFLSDAGALKQPLTGSTINFDRAWLEFWFPHLHHQFDYHNVDVSTIKGVLKKYMEPWVFEGAMGMKGAPVDRKLHRVQYCIEDSAAFLKWSLRLLDLI